ncbi:tyrosine-protein phosphatase non-receptor type 1-like isoform X2 [Argonauta hians]
MSSSVERQFKEYDQNGLWNGVFKKLKKAEDSAVIERNLSTSEARKPENRNKNRYRDVNPYDQSRIILDINNGCGDYINANLIEINEANRKYILTQGPLENTVGHFWQMVWEQKTMCIVMLNRIMEKGTVKCHQYWPRGSCHNSEDDLTFSDSGFKVSLLKEEENENYIVRSLKLQNLNIDKSRNVVHFQYTTWPDFGVPSSPISFLNFLMAVRESGFLSKDTGPCVVHCSAGIGRSGSFCLVDSALVIVEKEWSMDVIDVENMLQHMRYYRMGLVQTPDQLRFSYLSIIDGGKEILSNPRPVKNQLDTTSTDIPPMPPKRTTSLVPVEEKTPAVAAQKDTWTPIPAPRNLTKITNGDLVTTATTSTKASANASEHHPHKDIGGSAGSAGVVDSTGSDGGLTTSSALAQNGHQSVEYLQSVGSSTDPASTEGSEVDGYELRRRIREERKRNTQKLIEDMKRKQKECELMRQRNRYLTPLYIGIVLALGGGLLLYRYYNNPDSPQ